MSGIAKSASMSIASSLADARRDEFVYLDDRGDVLPAWRYRVREALAMPVTLSAAGAGAWAAATLGVPVLGAGFVAAAAWIGYRNTLARRVRTAAALALGGQLDAASEMLEAIAENRFTPRPLRGIARQDLGGIALRQGELERALEYVREAQKDLTGTTGPWRHINIHTEIHVLARLGRLDEAERRRQATLEAPDGAFFVLQRINTDLLLAFHREDASSLPEDLFPWARTALETTAAELALILLAWAHKERGDDDMAVHLLAEGVARMDRATFSQTFPEVCVWLESADRGESDEPSS